MTGLWWRGFVEKPAMSDAMATAAADPSSPWLTREQAAAYVQVHPNTIDSWIKKGGLPHTRVGRHVRIRINQLDEWMERGWQE